MASRQTVTLDHIRSFLSLNSTIKPLDVAPTATGGMGINNLDQYPMPEPRRTRITRGTDYVKREREIEKRLEKLNLTEPSPGPSEEGTLHAMDDTSTMTGGLPNQDDFNSERVQALYSTYYPTEEKNNGNLPIVRYRDQIMNLIKISRVVIIQGSTGCGKTTQVPQYILDHCAGLNQHCDIIVTQPRKIAAVSIARRVCYERKWELGKFVGYKVGLEDKTSIDTRLTYVTTGVLLQKLVNERAITKYTHVIIDEVHERDQDTDFVLLLVKKLIMTNSPHVKVIVMSATIDPTIFAKYFSLSRRGDPAPVVEIEQLKQSNVLVHYIEELSSLKVQIPHFDIDEPCIPDELYDLTLSLMYVFDRIEKMEQIDKKENPGTVLIFLPGYDEIGKMTRTLKPASVSRNYTLMPLHSSITLEEQANVFAPAPSGFRKVIISTNIAESSITVQDCKYVIDFCLTKNMFCDPDTNYSSLRLEWAAKSNCIQRKGRAGRVQRDQRISSKVYRLVPKAFYEQLLEFGIPEIQRTSLTQLVLYTKKINLGEPKHLLALALDPPELYGIEHAILMLKQVGALATTLNGEFSTVDGDLTFIGRVMSRLPLDVKSSKLIILGYCFGFLEECIIIAASLSLQSFLSKPFQRGLEYYKSALSWAHGSYSDCIIYLNAYRDWKRLLSEGQFNRPGGINEKSWGHHCCIQIKRIREVDRLVKELSSRLEGQNIVSFQPHHRRNEAHDTLLLKIIIAGAFFPNIYVQDHMDETTLQREICNGDVYSSVYLSGLPANHGVLYYHAIQQMMSICCTRMAIQFEERKAYIQFDRRVEIDPEDKDNTASVIHPAVYYAVKMRLMRMPLSLQVFSPHDAERRMQQLKRIQANFQGNTNELQSQRLMVQPNSYTFKRVDHPPIGQLTVNIFITHMDNPGKFWARYSDQEKDSLTLFIESSINPPDGVGLMPATENLASGALVLAPYGEGKSHTRFYRATVEHLTMDTALVFYIDYGNSKFVRKADLRQIPYDTAPDVYDTPALAFVCQLCEVKPSSLKSFQWTTEAISWFKDVTQNRTLHGKVYSVVQDTVHLELFGQNASGHAFSINRELINLGYAEEAEENLLSRQNYKIRMEFEESKCPLPLESDNRPFQLTTRDLMGTEGVSTTLNRIHLRGPFSPLEVSYSGMSYIDHYKTIQIEGDSVNSVSLNRDTADNSPQVLVASSVTLNQRQDSITLRSTTLMPRVKGLQSLLCLLFAPTVEFRTDRSRKAYTGALCGLGYDPHSGEPLCPDHDIEVPFDINIDYKDISDINAFRMGINLILGSESEFAEMQKSELADMQEKLKIGLVNLIKKKRIPKEPEPFPNCYFWGQVHPDHVLNAVLQENSGGDCTHVLPLHNAISLVDKASLEDSMKNHLKYLYNIASKSLILKDITCDLCSECFRTPRCLLLHLDSVKHKKKEQLLKN